LGPPRHRRSWFTGPVYIDTVLGNSTHTAHDHLTLYTEAGLLFGRAQAMGGRGVRDGGGREGNHTAMGEGHRKGFSATRGGGGGVGGGGWAAARVGPRTLANCSLASRSSCAFATAAPPRRGSATPRGPDGGRLRSGHPVSATGVTTSRARPPLGMVCPPEKSTWGLLERPPPKPPVVGGCVSVGGGSERGRGREGGLEHLDVLPRPLHCPLLRRHGRVSGGGKDVAR